ncbi:MAG: hypothetical protein A3K77_00840 [Euryarchaeota archaeon RBG_13_31_8]|nr:MAG: hypothetical protein A3K77_00840 [Euryarchaeota archaeon RBG_13_31_8]
MTKDEFKKIREEFGTQEEVAKLFEVTQQTISRWELGKRRVSKAMSNYILLRLEEFKKNNTK